MSQAALATEAKSATMAGVGALRVNEPADAYEREADRAAEQVISGSTREAAWSLSRIGMTAPLQRKIEMRHDPNPAFSGFARLPELVDRLNRISQGLSFSMKGNSLTYTLRSGTQPSNFDQQMQGFIDQAAAIPMRLTNRHGRLGDSAHGFRTQITGDNFASGYVDVDDLLASDDLGLQEFLVHMLRERTETPNYAGRLGSSSLEQSSSLKESQFLEAHEKGVDAEVALMNDFFGDNTIQADPTDTTIGPNDRAFINQHNDHIYSRIRQGTGEQSGVQSLHVEVVTADGKTLTPEQFRVLLQKQKAAGATTVHPKAIGGKIGPPVPGLNISAPGDALELEADRTAERALQRECSCGGICDECKKKNKMTLRGNAQGASLPANAPPIVQDVLRGQGRPLDHRTLNFMESRFGRDFSSVRIFNDDTAARSARAVSAHAYTVGDKIVFNQGRYAPESPSGRRLLAHELAHVVQQGSISPTLQRWSYAEIKESAYKKLVETARAATRVSLSALRQLASHLPASMQGGASTLIDIADVVIGAVFAVVLAVIGIIVGFGEGVADLVKGLVTLVLGVGKILFDVIKGLFTNFDAAKQDWNSIVETFNALPGAVVKMVKDWLDRFEKAPSERQSLMIGELTGQIIALIATWEISAGRAGAGAKVAAQATDIGTAAVRTADVATTAAKTADLASTAAKTADVATTAAKTADVGTTAAKATRPALRSIQGGGQSAARTAVSEGNAALKLAPEVEQAPKFVPRIVPPPPVTAPAEVATQVATEAANKGLGRGLAAGTGIAAAKGTQVATDADPKKKKKKKCEDAEPCGVLPIVWPSEHLPLPEGELVRTKGDLREVLGTDRGANQANFAACISGWKKNPQQLDLEAACPGHGFYQEGLQPSEPIDAHHIHPLYLGGGDDWLGNLGAIDLTRHRQGHRELDKQQMMFDTDPSWAQCNVCSPNLSQHPVDQEYRIESS